MTTLLPNAKQQFFDANGNPLAGGKVYFYIPGTTSFKTTWQDSSQIAANTNPIILDSAGEAVIYGLGIYRQVLFDALGNQIWDQLTSSTDSGGIYSGGTSTGTAANQILAATFPAGFALTAGNQLTFIAGFSSTGATTLNANGTGAVNITKPGASGPIPLAAGDILVGNAVELFYDGTQFQILNPGIFNPGGAINFAAATIASASTTNLGTVGGNCVDISGTATIASFGTVASGALRQCRITGAGLTLTHSATLICPGSVPLVLGQFDQFEVESYGGGTWVVIAVQRAGGDPTMGWATKATQQTGTDALRSVTASVQQQHPAALKGYGIVTSAGTAVVGSYPSTATSVKNSTGNYTVTHGLTFASTNYVVFATPDGTAGQQALTKEVAGTRTTTTITVEFMSGASLTDGVVNYMLAGQLA